MIFGWDMFIQRAHPLQKAWIQYVVSTPYVEIDRTSARFTHLMDRINFCPVLRCTDSLDSDFHSLQSPLSGVCRPTGCDNLLFDLISGPSTNQIACRYLVCGTRKFLQQVEGVRFGSVWDIISLQHLQGRRRRVLSATGIGMEDPGVLTLSMALITVAASFPLNPKVVYLLSSTSKSIDSNR